jgi:hypothetical protein
MREMKRQTLVLQSKVKLLEDEIDNLNEQVEIVATERNVLRRENHLKQFKSIQSLMGHINSSSNGDDAASSTSSSSSSNPKSLSPSQNRSTSSPNSSVTMPLVTSSPITQNSSIDRFLRFNNNKNYWSEMNTNTWDINYNTGNKYNSAYLNDNVPTTNPNKKVNRT